MQKIISMFLPFVMKNFHPIILLVALLVPAFASAGREIRRQVSLPEAMQLAMTHSPVIAQARSSIKTQLGVELSAKAEFLPMIDARAAYSAQDPERVESFGPMATPLDQSWLAGVEISYVIYNGGGRNAGVRAARASVKAAEDRLRAAVNDVLLAVATSYFDALLARDRILVQEEAQTVLGEQLSTARKRFEAGAGQQFAVLQAEVALANAKPALINARSAYRLAIERLREAAGVEYPEGLDGSKIELTSGWPPGEQPHSLEAALKTAAVKRPELAAALADIEQSRQALAGEIAQTRPTVAATTGYGFQSRSFTDDITTDPLHGWTAGVEMRIPLFDPGQARGRRMQAEARVETAEMAARTRQLAVEGEVRAAWLAVEEAREILATAGLVVKQAEEALRLARAGFDAGAGTQLEVLESRFALTQARLNSIQATHQYHTAVASLRRASGEAP